MINNYQWVRFTIPGEQGEKRGVYLSAGTDDSGAVPQRVVVVENETGLARSFPMSQLTGVTMVRRNYQWVSFHLSGDATVRHGIFLSAILDETGHLLPERVVDASPKSGKARSFPLDILSDVQDI